MRYLSALVYCGFGLVISRLTVADGWQRAIMNVLCGCVGFHVGYLGEMLTRRLLAAVGLW